MNKLGELWQSQNLKEKLSWLVVFHIIAFTSLLVLLNGIFHLPTTNGDISGWYSLIIGSTIGSYITFAILIYSNMSQKKTDDVIEKISTQQNQISSLVGDIKKITTKQEEMIREQKMLRE